ncbi:hypothetical protein [Streptomyces sp. SBT349]|uniref:hypothetical protein n=1 Tax=Streptomyces sp. SBT349 TaxID=1580539 RepID=UPI00066DBF32|nr:hypothetical protein [Streptomyces sp. SBT349]
MTAHAPGTVAVPLEVDVYSVRRGDEVMIGAQPFTVQDMFALANGRRRLEFTGGEAFTMNRTTVLWITRRVSPARRRRAYGPPP